MRFSTQVSIDLARDPELMAQCVEAGLTMIFVGIETPNQESLAETMKRQNLGVALAPTLMGARVLCNSSKSSATVWWTSMASTNISRCCVHPLNASW